MASPGQIPGVGNMAMGQPQVIDLRNAGLSGDLNERIQQAMQIAQQTMQKQGNAAAHARRLRPIRLRIRPRTW